MTQKDLKKQLDEKEKTIKKLTEEIESLKSKKKTGFKQKFTQDQFLNALSTSPQTTSQIMVKVGCKRDTAFRFLNELAVSGIEVDGKRVFPVGKSEVPAASGTGKMYLWKITEEGEIKRKEEEEN